MVVVRMSRSPCGERGLKSKSSRATPAERRSLPVRGAWIEIRRSCRIRVFSSSLPVRGAWIEITPHGKMRGMNASRSPCGERGLKYQVVNFSVVAYVGRSPCGERGLKLPCVPAARQSSGSLPVRGAWIEIVSMILRTAQSAVAPRAGSVD